MGGLTRAQLLDQMSGPTQEGAASSTAYRIAASDASDREQGEAHVTCDGTADNEQLQDAMDALA